MATNAVQGSAISTNGQTAVQTTKVVNSITGDKVLVMSFTNGNAGGGASMNPKLKLGAWRGTIPAAGGATTATVVDFDDYTSLQTYLRLIMTMVTGIRITSSDPSNFEIGKLTFVEKQPDGSERKVSRPVSDYMQALGGGSYANEVVLPSDVATFSLWQGLEVAWEGLKPQSSISFHLKVRGWNKSVELVPLDASTL